MRLKLIVGNWKMNLTRPEATACAKSLLELLGPISGVEVGLCPSYLSIPAVESVVAGSKVWLGAQDVFWVDSGAFTGQVSPSMLVDAGVMACIVGHSEPRGRFGKLEIPESTVGYFSETDETVNLKIKALLSHSIIPILCVGETLEEREANKTDLVIQAQLSSDLAGIGAAELSKLVVAYEPVWAIGTGRTCDTAEASRVCGMIRAHLGSLLNAETASSIRILYGGSVKPSNAREIFAAPDVDGGLVGGASLKAEDFAAVVRAAV